MKKSLLLLVAFTFVFTQVFAQKDCDECYRPTRERGIEKMRNATTVSEYRTAIKLFRAAWFCPDLPDKNDIEARIQECLLAIRRAQGDSTDKGKNTKPVEKMLIPGEVKETPDDKDASVKYPRKTERGELAALIKVYPTRKISENIVLIPEGGSLLSPPPGMTSRQTDGSWWFWVTPSTDRLRFKVKGFEDTDPVSVFLEAGKVYTVKLLIVEVPKEDIVIKEGWMRLSIRPSSCEVSYGPDITCGAGRKSVTDGRFEELLPYGEWYYRIESEGYETEVGVYTVSPDSDWENVELMEKVRYDYLTIESVPSGAEVRLDSEPIGTTPLYNYKIRKGSYRLQVSKDKYYIHSETLTANGEEARLNRQITLRHLYGSVVCRCTDPMADLVVINRADGSTVATVRDGGSVRVKDGEEYTLESRRSGYTPQRVRFSGSEAAGTTQEVRVSPPVWIPAGTLSVSVSGPSSAKVHITDPNGREDWHYSPVYSTMSPGNYTVWASAEEYRDSKPQTVSIYDRQTANLYIKLKKLPEFTRRQTEFASSFLNLTAGYHFASKDILAGLRYAWCASHMGFYAGLKYGVFSRSFGGTVGPVFRLTNDRSSNCDFQLFLGGGYFSNQFGGEAGMRFGWRSKGFSWWDFTLGAAMTQKAEVIPEVGIGLAIPISPIYGLVMLGIKSPEESEFASHFWDAIAGYNITTSDAMVGMQYAWCRTHLGIHVSAMYGVLRGGVAANIGPVFRLTNCWNSNCDYQLYGGIGYDYGGFGGEAGMRFGWKSSFGLSSWDFTLGVQAGPNGITPVIGLGWALALTVGGSVAAGLGTYYLTRASRY